MIDLRNDINRKEIPENENLKKLVDIVEKILKDVLQTCVANASDRKFSERKHFKILIPKQMLQRLPIALTQVKASN